MVIGTTNYKFLVYFSMLLVFPHPSILFGIFQLFTYPFEDNAVQ
jgi:hypothetical protein